MLPVIVQQPRVALAHEDHAAGRRTHDVIVFFEQRVHAFRQRLGVLFEPRIGHRLTAAGLVQRVFDLAAHLAQQFVRRPAHLGIHRIDVTGNEQSDLHSFFHFNAGPNPTEDTDFFRDSCIGNDFPSAKLQKKRARYPGPSRFGCIFHLISIRRAAAAASVTLRFGISMVITPFSTLAEILSRSTLSGSSRLCWNCV